jgi:putative DNA primase/helicase
METERGRTWAEAKIKALTGGDPIVARGMRQDFFTYDPQFKLVVTGNHVPSLGSVDEANRRRLHIIPFDVTIPVDERDPDLPEKLRAEFGGILNWCKEGSLACQREGLGMPDAVHAASAAYMEDEDAVGTWLAACCESDRNARTPSSVLFGSWKRWAEANNAPEGNPKTLTQALKAKGFEIHRPHGSVVVGLRMAAGELDFGCDKP